jgi:hypothetical protein
MKPTRMLPVLVALSVPALSASQGTAPATPVRSRTQMEQQSAERGQNACAPGAVLIAPAMPMRVIGSYERGRMLFGPNDSLIIGAGTNQGLRVGQEYLVRRVVHDQFTPMTAASVLVSIHTAGWVRIVDAKEDMSVATVTQACDGVIAGDYLEPLEAPSAAMSDLAALAGRPDYEHPARLVLADERHQMGVAGSLMLIDRGSDDGVRAGQRMTVFRQTVYSLTGQAGYSTMYPPASQRGPAFNVGDGTVLNVRPKTSLVRIDTTNDAVYVGDMVALHR